MRKQVDKAEKREKFASLQKIAKAFDAFRPASTVLKAVSAVPTRFVQFDHATKVGGLPIERFTLLHGPSGEGKTTFILGLLDSFLECDFPVLYIDSERTTPHTWAARLFPKNADHVLFKAARPDTYEDATILVRDFCNALKEQRDAGNIDSNYSGLIICDSIRKLVPKDHMKKIQEDAKHGLDGMSGRGAMAKAALNAMWMDELVPLLEDSRAAFVCIARETDDGEANKWAKMAGNDFKVGGGKALYYDSSMVIRVQRAGYIYEKDTDTKGPVYGERHRVTIRKTKVSSHEEKQSICYYHTSNGNFLPYGFDRARDLLDIGERFQVIEKRGAWYSYETEKLGCGANAAVKNIAENPTIMSAIEAAVRLRFDTQTPIEVTDDGEIIG